MRLKRHEEGNIDDSDLRGSSKGCWLICGTSFSVQRFEKQWYIESEAYNKEYLHQLEWIEYHNLGIDTPFATRAQALDSFAIAHSQHRYARRETFLPHLV